MLARRPLVVNLACARVHPRPTPAHRFDDAPDITDENIRVVHVILLFVQDRRCGADRFGEAGGIGVDAVAGTEPRVPFALKRGAGIDQGEIDVEEHSGGRRHRHRSWPEYGPATTTVAFDGLSVRQAASWISSRVTAWSSPGTRRS